MISESRYGRAKQWRDIAFMNLPTQMCDGILKAYYLTACRLHQAVNSVTGEAKRAFPSTESIPQA
ncbi:MAG TPA: hypothetical protein DHT39_01700 [Pantoea sp.]|nr:hypothetical protein [Pantoea sp.]